ncbi:MAG: glutaredoxin family protein [Chitinispirillaceae bacterium]|nr:glutaredoxin family protein [Chitinispirillaceae bacterium]
MTTGLEEKFRAKILLFALSTCPMCRQVKKLLGELGVEFEYVDVDLLEGEEKTSAKKEMLKWDRRRPFPMLIINNANCIIGDEPDKIRKALGL